MEDKMMHWVLWVFVCSVLTAGMAICATEGHPVVGVYYFPGWYRGKGDPKDMSSEWRMCVAKCPKPRALCGFYDDSDPRLWDYYVDWMTGHGIDFIAFDWYYNDREDLLGESLDKGFLQSRSADKIKFALHWCNHKMPWSKPMDQSRDKLLGMIDWISERYLGRPNYLRIDGKPVFMIYDIDQLLAFGGFDAVKSSLRAMRGRAIKHGFGGLYLVAVYSGVSARYVQLCRELGFDAFCAYTYVGTRYPPLRWDSQNIPYETCVANCLENIYPFLSRLAKDKGITYWPTTFPGWDDRPRAGVERAFVTEGNTPERFGKMFRGAMQYVDPACPVVMIEAWNEWGEGACLEPDMQYGFGYLQQVARALGKKPANPRVPSAQEIASWSVLTEDEVAASKAIEGRAWKPKKPTYLDIGSNRSVPAVKLPITLDLASGGAEVQVYGARIERRDKNGTLVVSESVDPQLIVRTPDIPTCQIKRITISFDVCESESGSACSIELFFLTVLYPESSAFCSAQLGPPRGKQMSVYTNEIMGWDKFGTPLTGIRVDFAQSPGVKCLLKAIVLE